MNTDCSTVVARWRPYVPYLILAHGFLGQVNISNRILNGSAVFAGLTDMTHTDRPVSHTVNTVSFYIYRYLLN